MTSNPTRDDQPGTAAGSLNLSLHASRALSLSPPFDLARTVAPAWWARGRWPNVDWGEGLFTWVGWELGEVVWRSVRQSDDQTLRVSGSGRVGLDRSWAARVLGIDAVMPSFAEPVLVALARQHRGMKPWAAGSLYEGVVSSIVGQSISVAAAATTERRLYALFNDEVEIGNRPFWPPPRPEQLAAVDAAIVRSSGVTTKRANALVEIARGFSTGMYREFGDAGFDRDAVSKALLAISGIGPWTVRSAMLWGLGEPDAHPTGDVALLRAVRRRYPHVSTLSELDRMSDAWRPHRAWAARLFWLDLLGYGG